MQTFPDVAVACGEEASDPLVLHDGRVVRVDELAGSGHLAREARDWYERYHRPFWVAETSNLGLDVGDGPRWLDRLVAGIDRLRADDLPVHGICWYSRGDQYDWQTMLTRPVGDVTNLGLFDAHRVARPVAARYAASR